MSDARWLDIEVDLDAAVRHFGNASALYREGGFEADDLPGYRARMAFMHAMQAAHTSLESGLVRILDMLGEERPSGAEWHADLIRRLARERPGRRPAFLPPALAAAADETRRFRNVAVRSYDGFRSPLAAGPVAAGELLAASLKGALADYRAALDPTMA